MIMSQLAGAVGWFGLAPWVIGFPLLGLIVNLLIGSKIPERLVGWIASAAVGLAFVVAVLQFFAVQADPAGREVAVATWISVGSLNIQWALKVDSLSVMMMLMVSGVSALIHIYAIGYMHADVRFKGDPHRYRRFFVYFNLFVALMMVLVTADSYLMMFVGWEGVGLCSYLLISFWFEGGLEGLGNAIAGKKAFVVNRIGDVGFLLAMFITFWTFGSLQFDAVFHQAQSMGAAAVGPVTVITLLLLLGVAGKSAQLPLFVWLPDAMAGPTPVSALIHAATMVTAGIYLVARNHVLFALAPVSANTAAMLGALTALFSATIAVAQFDIKKVLAYSTISQLGFMLAAVGLGGYVAGLFHLVTHAFFKALLFLGAGSVIQGVEHAHEASHGEQTHGEPFDPQDMRNMGGLRTRMKTTFWVYLIAGLSLAGVPPLSGFFSKDEILLDALHANPVVYALLAAAAFLTAFYIGRQLFMVFAGQPRTESAKQAKENPPVMTLPLVGLALLAVLGGGLNFPGTHALAEWLKLTISEIEISGFDFQVAGISTAIALVALVLAWWIYGRKPMTEGSQDPLRSSLGALFTALSRKWWVDELYAATVVRGYEGLAALMVVGEDAQFAGNKFWTSWLDQIGSRKGKQAARGLLGMVVDLSFVDSIMITSGDLAKGAAQRLSKLQTGFIRNYALAILLGILGVLVFMIFGGG